MQVVAIPDGALLVDAYAPLTQQQVTTLSASVYGGRTIKGMVRYHENLTEQEVGWALAAGWGVMTVGVARADAMRSPSSELGARDGLTALQNIRRLGLPVGFTNWLDVEGSVTASAQQVASYVNTWAGVMRGHTEAGMYEGWGINMTAAQLYHLLAVRRYWASSPKSLPPGERGFGLVQLVENFELAGVKVDVDEHRLDQFGESCKWLVA